MSFSKKKKLKNSKRNKKSRTEKNLLHRLFGGFGRPNILSTTKNPSTKAEQAQMEEDRARVAANRKGLRAQKMNAKLAAQATTKPSEATRLAAIATRLDAIATEKTLEANRLADLATSKQEEANRLAALVTKRLEAEQLAAQAKAEQLAAQAKAEQLAEAQRLAAANSTPLKYPYQVSIDRGPDRKIQVQITRSSDYLNKPDRKSKIDAASLKKQLTEAVAAAMRDKPKDPIQFLSDQVASFAAKNRATQNRATQNWAKARASLRATQKLAKQTAKKTDRERASETKYTVSLPIKMGRVNASINVRNSQDPSATKPKKTEFSRPLNQKELEDLTSKLNQVKEMRQRRLDQATDDWTRMRERTRATAPKKATLKRAQATDHWTRLGKKATASAKELAQKTVANKTKKVWSVWSPEQEDFIQDLRETALITKKGTERYRQEKARRKEIAEGLIEDFKISTLKLGPIKEEDENPFEVKLGGRATKN